MNAVIIARSSAAAAPVGPSAPPLQAPRLRLVRGAEAPAPQVAAAAIEQEQRALRTLITLRRSAPLAGASGGCAPEAALDRLVSLARRPN